MVCAHCGVCRYPLPKCRFLTATFLAEPQQMHPWICPGSQHFPLVVSAPGKSAIVQRLRLTWPHSALKSEGRGWVSVLVCVRGTLYQIRALLTNKKKSFSLYFQPCTSFPLTVNPATCNLRASLYSSGLSASVISSRGHTTLSLIAEPNPRL